METLPKSISTVLPVEENSQSRFICIKAVSPTIQVHCLEIRSFQSGDRYPTTDLGQSVPLYILPHSTSLEESELRPNRKTLLVTSTWQSQIWHPILLEISIVCPLLLPRNKSLKNPQGEVDPLTANRTLRLAVWTISGEDYLRREFQKQLPNLLQVKDEKVQSQIIIRPGEWASCCGKQQVDAFRCDAIKILDYLAFLFGKGYECKTIGYHRSAISTFHDYVDGKPLGQHPEVCALVSGIFNNRSPQPRYMFVWSVESVMNYIKTKCKKNEILSEKYLTYKLVVSMALTSASRAFAMHYLNVRFMVKSDNAYIFTFHKL